MAFNTLNFGSSQTPLFNDNDNDNMSPPNHHPNYYHSNSDLLDIQTSWNENIDPLLQQQSAYHYQQQQRLQTFINAPQERTLFTAPPSYPQYHQGVRSLPQAQAQRHISPALSHEFSGSTGSTSARSPPAEQDLSYYSPQGRGSGRDDFYLQGQGQSQSHDLRRSGFYDFEFDPWAGNGNAGGASVDYGHVNMSQVQSFPDTIYDSTGADEGFIDMQIHQSSKSHDGQQYHMESRHDAISHSVEAYQGHHYPVDEALGASIKDATSPADSTLEDNPSQANSPEEVIEEEEEQEEEDEDEYVPTTTRSGRTSRKRAFSSTYSAQYQSSPSSKRARQSSNAKPLAKPKSRSTPSHHRKSSAHSIKNNLQSSNGSLACPSCPTLSPFEDSAALSHHISSAHTRPYTCIFSFAGCSSTFASKNEWKRHVQSQHLNLHAWVCRLGACGKGSEFNRKDLFTQHCRRMHAPPASRTGHAGGNGPAKGNGKQEKNEEWEERLKELQISCLVTKRQAPKKLRCVIEGCEVVFEGKVCWDEMLEHVGKHVEKVIAVAASAAGDGATAEMSLRQGEDRLLVEWAESQGIVSRKRDGSWGFKSTSPVPVSNTNSKSREGSWEGVKFAAAHHAGATARLRGASVDDVDAEGEADDGYC